MVQFPQLPLLEDCLRFRESLRSINTESVPIYIFTNNPVQFKICGFADASEKAYGVALYVVSLHSSGEQTSHFLSIKNRVSPIKTVTIPCIELNVLCSFISQIDG